MRGPQPPAPPPRQHSASWNVRPAEHRVPQPRTMSNPLRDALQRTSSSTSPREERAQPGARCVQAKNCPWLRAPALPSLTLPPRALPSPPASPLPCRWPWVKGSVSSAGASLTSPGTQKEDSPAPPPPPPPPHAPPHLKIRAKASEGRLEAAAAAAAAAGARADDEGPEARGGAYELARAAAGVKEG